jgi:hypothetical protein
VKTTEGIIAMRKLAVESGYVMENHKSIEKSLRSYDNHGSSQGHQEQGGRKDWV